MGKFSEYERSALKTKPWKIHPVWRGIGCIMMVLIPLMSYFGGIELLKANARNGWFIVPVEFTGPPAYPYLYAKLTVCVLLMVFSFGALVILYMLVARLSGMSRYGPLDVKPVRPSKKKRRR